MASTEDVKKAIIDSILKKSVTTESEPSITTTLIPDDMFNSESPLRKINGVSYKSMFGKLPKGMPDFDISNVCFKDEDWEEEDRIYIPDIKEFDNYFTNPDVAYPIVLGLVNNMNTVLVGPTGCGKTSIVRMIASKLRWPFLQINGRQDMESDTLLGKPWVNNGSMEFKMGDLPKARKKGWLVLFDEVNKIPAGIQMALQRMYERNGVLQLDDMPTESLKDKQIYPHKNTRLIKSDNVVGVGDGLSKYGATMIQDASSLNRDELVIECDYLNQKDEVKMLMAKYPFLTQSWCDKMVQLAGLIRKAFKEEHLSATMSPRQLNTWAEVAYIVGDYKKAFDMVMMGRFPTDEEKGVIANLWNTVYPK